MIKDEFFMARALAEAEAAAAAGEVPVGAVVVKDGQIIGRGRNTREAENNPLGHAELAAISAAAEALGDWRLSGCTLYVTLEPCCMCAGAVINSRIERVVYAAADKEAGCLGSAINMAHLPFSAPLKITTGVLEPSCSTLLESFFEKMRQSGKK